MEHHTLITIGRQIGSGGKLVAQELGRRLDIPVYDQELIARAAEESGFSQEILRKNDEKRSLFSFRGAFDDELFGIQSDAIRSIADRGDAILVGRCADYVLRDRLCLDVFLSAPAEVRARRVAERRGISIQEAAKFISKGDRSRETYYNYFTFGNWGVASNYDLCLDTSLTGIEGAAEIIIDFARRMGVLR